MRNAIVNVKYNTYIHIYIYIYVLCILHILYGACASERSYVCRFYSLELLWLLMSFSWTFVPPVPTVAIYCATMFAWIGDGPEDGCDVHNGDRGAGGDSDNDAADWCRCRLWCRWGRWGRLCWLCWCFSALVVLVVLVAAVCITGTWVWYVNAQGWQSTWA